MNLCTVEDVKNASTISLGNARYDEVATKWIPIASQLVRDYCRRKFAKNVYIQYFDTIRNDNGIPYSFWLQERPLDPLVDVELKLAYDYKWANVAVIDAQYYRIDDDAAKITLFNYITSYAGGVLQITYEGGYAIDSEDTNLVLVPEHVKEATAIQVVWFMRRQINANEGTKNKKKGKIVVGLDTLSIHSLVSEARLLLRGEVVPLVGSVHNG